MRLYLGCRRGLRDYQLDNPGTALVIGEIGIRISSEVDCENVVVVGGGDDDDGDGDDDDDG